MVTPETGGAVDVDARGWAFPSFIKVKQHIYKRHVRFMVLNSSPTNNSLSLNTIINHHRHHISTAFIWGNGQRTKPPRCYRRPIMIWNEDSAVGSVRREPLNLLKSLLHACTTSYVMQIIISQKNVDKKPTHDGWSCFKRFMLCICIPTARFC